MPHYYFDLTDGVKRRDRRGLDCTDDANAIVKAATIAKEVAAAGGHNSHPNLHISIMLDEQEVSRVPVPCGIDDDRHDVPANEHLPAGPSAAEADAAMDRIVDARPKPSK